ncbi:hypothetical protein [Actinacidiphila soli]|uniref:hypothetical protein n=1 Tax=Actinacidiphila soli TaxID=2487275 RepID=UPI0013E34D97|nr:hypothetical protein [Actinacidiphila soli]
MATGTAAAAAAVTRRCWARSSSWAIWAAVRDTEGPPAEATSRVSVVPVAL